MGKDGSISSATKKCKMLLISFLNSVKRTYSIYALRTRRRCIFATFHRTVKSLNLTSLVTIGKSGLVCGLRICQCLHQRILLSQQDAGFYLPVGQIEQNSLKIKEYAAQKSAPKLFPELLWQWLNNGGSFCKKRKEKRSVYRNDKL